MPAHGIGQHGALSNQQLLATAKSATPSAARPISPVRRYEAYRRPLDCFADQRAIHDRLARVSEAPGAPGKQPVPADSCGWRCVRMSDPMVVGRDSDYDSI